MIKPVFRSKDATGLLRDAEHILVKMMENAELFENPVPDLASFERTLEAYREAYAEATYRDKRAVVLKGQRGKAMQKAIYRLSHYVDSVADGDPSLILAAGYRANRPTTVSIGRTPTAENLRVQHLQVGSGIIKLRVKAWKPARLYRYEYRLKGGDGWEGVLHSKSSIEIDYLNKLQEYEFRAAYVGRDIDLNFSETVTALVV